jgi:hypothetical protein
MSLGPSSIPGISLGGPLESVAAAAAIPSSRTVEAPVRPRRSSPLTGPDLGSRHVVRGAVLVGEGQVRDGYAECATDRLPAVTGLPFDKPPRRDLRADLHEPPLVASHDVPRDRRHR